MILSLVLSLALVQSQDKLSPITCPMTGEAVGTPAGLIDFAGTRYEMCCAGCPEGFKKDPAAAIKAAKAKDKDKTYGIFLFDPISNARIDAKAAKASSDYKSTRYYFATADEKTTFDADPKKYAAKAPKKEVLYCPVAGHAIKGYAAAGGFIDIDGTRYYTCCTNCLAKLKADNTLASKAPADQVKAPAAIDAPAQK